MPIYEYKCRDCGKEFEIKLPMSKSGENQSCPECQSSKTRRIFSSVAIGGSSLPDLPDMNSSPSSCPGGVCGL